MRVAILTSGRFWLCDLARELDRCGHEVYLYSLVPAWRTRRFGLPDRCNRWLGPYLAPLFGLRRALRATRYADMANQLLSIGIDTAAARLITSCDVFIGLSQLSRSTLRRVRRRFGAHTFLERGNRHILSQRDILAQLPANGHHLPQVPQWAVRRELAEYESADVIVVPSAHVQHSFQARGVPAAKLFRNPYGVDLAHFPPTLAPPAGTPPTVIMVGTWSLRKGCDALAEAWCRLTTRGSRLLHVGGLGDAPLPKDPGFTHHDTVDQHELTNWYAQAHVMALASREEGLALVQAQGLASGLHLVATDRTGADDLQAYVTDPATVRIAPAGDVFALAATIDTQLDRACRLVGRRDLLGSGRARLSWEAYGRRYDARLRSL